MEVLKRRQQASVTELSQALGLTPVTIRHHLDSLAADRVVSEPVPRRKSGPGRPEMVYSLTARADEMTPRNYGELCSCLLQALERPAAPPGPALVTAGTELGARLRGAGGESGFGVVLDFLEARGYFPSLEDDEFGSVVVLANCPYLEVARATPEFCRFDVALLQSALGAKVIPEANIALNDPACRLRITPAPGI